MNRVTCLIRRLWIGLLALLFLASITFQAFAGSYPSDTTTQYAGMVKPQNNLGVYSGVVNSEYSTVYLGNYLSGGEGSGSHPGVDIQDGESAMTAVRSVAQGEITRIVSDWQNRYPDRNPCGNNSDLGGWGNYVMIKHDVAPARGEYAGASKTIYAHLWGVTTDLAVGNKVLRGTLIGFQGSTGGSTGPHLHFQMDKNVNSTFPWWPDDLDVNSTSWQSQVRQNTFNPMRFTQAHLVSTIFIAPGATARYFDEQGVLRSQSPETEADHEWFLGKPPISNIWEDNFSAQWDGTIDLPLSGLWTFYVSVDDGARLYLDGELVINQWVSRTRPATFKVQRYLIKGSHSIFLEYFEDINYATIQLAWQLGPKINLPIVIQD